MFVMVHYGTDDPDVDLRHDRSRAGPRVVPDDRRLERAALRVDGRGLQHLSERVLATSGAIPAPTAFPGYVANWRQAVDNGTQAPLMTPPDRIDAARARRDRLSKARRRCCSRCATTSSAATTMDRAMREYARRWAFKHPTPGDFFRTVENVSGEDLVVVLERVLLRHRRARHRARRRHRCARRTGRTSPRSTLRRVTSDAVPGDAAAQVQRRSTQDVKLPVEIWSRGDRYTATIPVQSAGRRCAALARPARSRLEPSNDAWGDAAGRPIARTPRRRAGGHRSRRFQRARPSRVSADSGVERQGNRPDGSAVRVDR